MDSHKNIGYIVSNEEEININDKHEIYSFDILHKTDLNIYVVEYNNVSYNNIIFNRITKLLYKNNIMTYAYMHGHFKVLEWFKKSGYEFKYSLKMVKIFSIDITKREYYVCLEKASKFFIQNINIKKIIKYSIAIKKTLKLLKFKTKNNYVKGYNKN